MMAKQSITPCQTFVVYTPVGISSFWWNFHNNSAELIKKNSESNRM